MLVMLLLGCLCLLVDINLTRVSTGCGPLVHQRHPSGTAGAHQASRMAMIGRGCPSVSRGAGAPGGGHPLTTIFCVPQPFLGDRGALQRQVILSWLHSSSPPPQVVLLGSHPTFDALAQELAPHVTVDGRIDRSFAGTPLANSVLARAQHATTEVSVLVGDVILLGGFFRALAKLGTRRTAWLMTGVAWDTPGRLPFSFSLNPLRSRPGEPLVLVKEIPSKKLVMEHEVAAYVQAQGSLRTQGAPEFLAWNNLKGVPLIKGPVPPFAHGHGGYYSWLIHEAALRGLRTVVDASLSATGIRVQLENTSESSDSSAYDPPTRDSGHVQSPLPSGHTSGTQGFEPFLNLHLSYRWAQAGRFCLRMT